MPTYDYRCLKCKKTFEVVQRMLDKPIAKCIRCGGKSQRVIGAGSGIIFKGSGFYQTDYKNKKETPPCAASGTCPVKSDSKSCAVPKKSDSTHKSGGSGGKK
jgi:putative FmdB family regulatory protein